MAVTATINTTTPLAINGKFYCNWFGDWATHTHTHTPACIKALMLPQATSNKQCNSNTNTNTNTNSNNTATYYLSDSCHNKNKNTVFVLQIKFARMFVALFSKHSRITTLPTFPNTQPTGWSAGESRRGGSSVRTGQRNVGCRRRTNDAVNACAAYKFMATGVCNSNSNNNNSNCYGTTVRQLIIERLWNPTRKIMVNSINILAHTYY
ncbi:unnamed protein product [Ceratitis capitata]|uniref:(Mediterranean fruit fly) hypothetical protein n=1 Tax=Ceratitis capitata TaxID=7213 RepID=A0A811UN28_CERCA|nr:unnamed protein product [Ceratitis capitata]